MWFPEHLEDTPFKSCKPHEKQNKKHQNVKSNGEKLKNKSLMLFASCDLKDFKF